MSFLINVQKRFPGKRLDLRFETPGGLTAVFGPSGAGKSSLIAMMAGVMCPDAGHIEIAGEVVFDSKARINIDSSARGAGLVFQDGRLFPHLSVKQNLLYGQNLSRRAPVISLEETIGFLGLDALIERKPQSLSGGEAQRVAIGRALLSAPRCLLLDEPLSSLDGGRKSAILGVIEDLRDRLKIPMLYVSHDLSEVKRLADHLVLIGEGGEIEAAGPVNALLTDPALSVAKEGEAGSVLSIVLGDYDATYDLSQADIGGQSIWLPGKAGAAGQAQRLTLRASEVTLSLEPPVGSSALNVLKGRIVNCTDLDAHRLSVSIDLEGADQRLISHVTKKSGDGLGLKPDQIIYAQLKTQGLRRI